MAMVKTVKVKADNDHGYMIINESDFDKEVHEKYKAPKTPPKPAEGEGEGEVKVEGEKPVSGAEVKPNDPKKADK